MSRGGCPRYPRAIFHFTGLENPGNLRDAREFVLRAAPDPHAKNLQSSHNFPKPMTVRRERTVRCDWASDEGVDRSREPAVPAVVRVERHSRSDSPPSNPKERPDGT